jgi:hypothetical protein
MPMTLRVACISHKTSAQKDQTAAALNVRLHASSKKILLSRDLDF